MIRCSTSPQFRTSVKYQEGPFFIGSDNVHICISGKLAENCYVYKIPTHEILREEPPIIRVIEKFFSEAYAQQIDGGTPLREDPSTRNLAETIALNPKDYDSKCGNLRFILAGYGLGESGTGVDIDGERLTVQYAVRRLTLPTGNSKPVERLPREERRTNSTFSVFSNGHVMRDGQLLGPDETKELTEAVEACELAPEFPGWAKGAAI